MTVAALKSLGLRDLALRCVPLMPVRVRLWVENVKLKRQIINRPRLIIEEEIRSKFTLSLALLRKLQIDIGDYLEFGVYNCSSLICMYQVLKEHGFTETRLIGFDSFEGLPDIAQTDCEGHWKPGEFKSSYEFALSVLEHEGIPRTDVTLVKGFFNDTLTATRRSELGLRRAGVIMIDCDLYQSAKEALEFCRPLIVDKSVLLFDDWFPLANRNLGEKQAFDEFLAAEPLFSAEELFDFAPYGKAFLVSRGQNVRG